MKLEIAHFFSTVKLSDFRVLLVCFSFGFIIRLVPELLANPLPIGFDTIYYAVLMKSGVVWTHWSTVFTTTWLLNALVVPLYGVIEGDPFLLLKVVAPMLYGLNVAGVYWFTRKTLGWNLRMGILAGVFFALQLASLRISWDLLKNTLGLGVLLFALSYTKNVNTRTGFFLFTSLSIISVLAHEYSAVTLLVSVLGLVAWQVFKKRVDSSSKRLLIGVFPALGVFLTGIWLRFFPVPYQLETNVVGARDSFAAHNGAFFLVDYLRVNSSVDRYASYSALAFSVLLLFVVLFLPYLFLVAKGYFRNGILNLWTSLLLIGAFGCLAFPSFALEYWHRWMFMLVYPFTFYAVNGLNKAVSKLPTGKPSFLPWIPNKKAVAMVLLTFSLGVAYLASPLTMVYTGSSVPSVSGTYLYFSTSPTVPYQDVNSVVQAMNWLNVAMGSGSCAILQHAFFEWGRLYLDKSHTIVHFENSVESAVNTAFDDGFNNVFFVWWNQPIGWYGVSVPDSFASAQDFGRISIYEYEVDNVGGS